ncbi:hypothetical protein [Streptomyces violaceusniger]|uniref:Uncharacterized protein n=1 Tax=Streptomyces violaceusniger (strain Tu 4113) TaxID=653045 RepID=G2PHC9_STRV4|nr:hypothetical protein [Streptomyces violaceusniger]AEM88775.1 hypothetical protein Strvi_9528 [Streptomyces violaceusniger Tu 4113]
MWSVEDVARDAAQRQGRGLSAAQVAEKVTEASRRERETQQQLKAPAWTEIGPFAPDPEHLPKLWAAKHTEWRRIAALLKASGEQEYNPEQDTQGMAWAQEREARRQGAVDRHAAWMRERRDAKDERRAQVWLSADTSRRLRAIAARAGLQPEQVLAQLAENVRTDEEGAVVVAPFTPRPVEES